METLTRLQGKFVWFEHVSNEVEAASRFYAEWLGWQIERMPMGDAPYPMILNAGEGIGGFRAAEPGGRARWESYLSVADVDERCRAAAAAGAQVLMPPTDFGQVGRAAALRDPTGAAVNLWTGGAGDRPDGSSKPVGDWYWNELWTPDAAKALAFYAQVAGYTHDVMPMGEAGDYFLLKTGEAMRGGITQSTEMAPQWLPYVHVAACDAAVERARAHRGVQVVVPPSDIPGVGRFSILVDPFGAAVAVITGLPMG